MARTPAALLVNPTAGGGRYVQGTRPSPQLEALERDLATEFDLETTLTESSDDTQTRAARAGERGFEVVFALGGDGTFRDTATGLLGTGVALGTLGGGTTNVLPLALGLPRAGPALARALSRGYERSAIDVGVCVEPGDVRHLFLMMVSRGLDARALARTPPALKRAIGRMGIGAAALAEWLRAADAAFDLEVGSENLRATFAALHNIELYGGKVRMAPGAQPDDGLLSIVAAHLHNRWEMARFARATLTARHVRLEGVHCSTAPRARFPGSEKTLLQIDGDPLEVQLPLEIEVQPGALQIVRPTAPR